MWHRQRMNQLAARCRSNWKLDTLLKDSLIYLHWLFQNFPCNNITIWNIVNQQKLSFCWFMCPFSFFLFVCFHFRVSSAGQFRKTSILLTRVNMKAAASSTRSHATSASCAALRSASPWAWRWTVSYWKLMFNNCISKKINLLSSTVRNQHGTCCGNVLPTAKQFYVELWCIPEELVSSFWSPQNVSLS